MWKLFSRDAKLLRQYKNGKEMRNVLFCSFCESASVVSRKRKLTKLYSSLFPRSSSSSLWSIDSDLWRWKRGQRLTACSTTWTTLLTQYILNTYSGRDVSRFSRSSNEPKLERLQWQAKKTMIFYVSENAMCWSFYTSTSWMYCITRDSWNQIMGTGSALEVCLSYQGCKIAPA